ncbi:MAG: hypothetical protein KGH62_04370 [Candidatus Micrarchaeota archaeon]|nr:hypothetical protein [Candidatus Micrarchaeota archaeon]
MFAYVGNSNKEIARLHEALKESARNDPVADAARKSAGRGLRIGASCIDGWGYVIVTNGSVMHYRSATPIFDDSHKIPEIEGRSFAIFHARKASDQKKLGLTFSHPFLAVNKGDMLYLAHNGMVKMRPNPSSSDTEYALKVLNERGVEAGIERLESQTISGLNLMLLEIEKPSNIPSLKFFNYYNNPTDNPHLSNYFNMYYSANEDGIAVVSSTLLCYGITSDGKVPYAKLMHVEELEHHTPEVGHEEAGLLAALR